MSWREGNGLRCHHSRKRLVHRVPRAQVKEIGWRENPAVPTRLDARKHRPINGIRHFHSKSIVRNVYTFS